MPYASLKEVFPDSSFLTSNSYSHGNLKSSLPTNSFLKTSNQRFSNSETTDRHSHIMNIAPKFHDNLSVQSPIEGIYKDQNYADFKGNGNGNSFGTTRNLAFQMNSAMEKALEYDTMSCHSFFNHFKECPDCREKALDLLGSENGGRADFLNSQIPFKPRQHPVDNYSPNSPNSPNSLEGYNGVDYSHSNNSNTNTNSNKTFNKIEELIELILFIGSGIFLLFILGN